MFFEIIIGVSIAMIFIVGAVSFAFRTPNIKGPSRHNIRGDGDYSGGHQHYDSFDSGGDGD